MNVISGTIYVASNGDTYTWDIVVTNNSAVSATSVSVTNTISSGVIYSSHIASKGTMNTTTFLWTIGTMAPGEVVTLKLTMEVDDINDAPYNIHSEVSSFGTESTPLDNEVDNDVYDLCTAFSNCFVNEKLFHITDIGEGTQQEAIDAAVPTPSCGDVVIIGNSCENTYFSMYSCEDSSWSSIVQISTQENHATVLYVSPVTIDTLKGSTSCTYATIQDAVDDAVSGDTIVILPSTYTLTDPIDISGKANLTFNLNPGVFIVGGPNKYVFYDDNTYIGYLRITGGGTIQGNYSEGLISINNTDPTSILDIDNISVINEDGNGIVTSVPTSLNTVGIYDVAGSSNCLVCTDALLKIQVRNTFSNVVEDIAGTISLEHISVDTDFSIHYI